MKDGERHMGAPQRDTRGKEPFAAAFVHGLEIAFGERLGDQPVADRFDPVRYRHAGCPFGVRAAAMFHYLGGAGTVSSMLVK